MLSQQERKREKATKTLEDPVEEPPVEQPKVVVEPFIQEKILLWLGDQFKRNFTADKFIQLLILALAVNQAYVAFDAQYQAPEDLNLLISTACGIVALFAGMAIAFQTKSRILAGEGITVDLPKWNTVYLVFLPVMLPYVFYRDLMLYNAAFASSVLDLPVIAKLVIQTSIIGSNSQHGDTVENVRAVGLNLALNYILGRVSELRSLDKVEVALFSTLVTDLYIIDSQQLYVVLLQKLFISYGAGAAVVYGITQLWKANNLARSLVVLTAWAAVFISSALYQLEPVLGANAIEWLYVYISSSNTRVRILGVWLLSLLLLIPSIFNYKIALSPNSRRKIWHFLVLILVAYPLHVDPEFVKLSLSGSLVLFLIVEMVRYLKLAPFGTLLDSHLREFADWRDDKGPIIISYIYLFIGITLPILFDNSVVGLVVLGVGDSLASIVGSKWGEINWAHSDKTVEGTLTFIVSTFVMSSFFKLIGWFFADKSYYALLLTCTLSGLLEGNSDMNDNIMIPGFMLVIMAALH